MRLSLNTTRTEDESYQANDCTSTNKQWRNQYGALIQTDFAKSSVFSIPYLYILPKQFQEIYSKAYICTKNILFQDPSRWAHNAPPNPILHWKEYPISTSSTRNFWHLCCPCPHLLTVCKHNAQVDDSQNEFSAWIKTWEKDEKWRGRKRQAWWE